MSPVIVVGRGRVVDVVFKKGFGLKLQDSTSQGKLIKPPTGIGHSDVDEEQYYSGDSSVSQGSHTSHNLAADRGDKQQ